METTDTYTLPDHMAPYDASMPGLEAELIEAWGELMEWGVVEIDGGCEVV